MPRDWRDRARDILEAIARIDRYTAAMTAEEFFADTRTQDAVIRNLEVIGEAARAIAEEPRAARVPVPWPKIRGMRNILAHEYFDVDVRIVWETVRGALPPLRTALETELSGRQP